MNVEIIKSSIDEDTPQKFMLAVYYARKDGFKCGAFVIWIGLEKVNKTGYFTLSRKHKISGPDFNKAKIQFRPGWCWLNGSVEIFRRRVLHV